MKPQPNEIGARFENKTLPGNLKYPFAVQVLILVAVTIERPLVTRQQHFMAPKSRNPQFSGKDGELALLDEYLTELDNYTCSTYSIVAIHGLGGVGYAHSLVGTASTQTLLKISSTCLEKPNWSQNMFTEGRRENQMHLSFGLPLQARRALIYKSGESRSNYSWPLHPLIGLTMQDTTSRAQIKVHRTARPKILT